MKRSIVFVIVFVVLASGCESLRFAPTQEQKQNAWVHLRTTQLAADAARTERCSQQLQQLTLLSATQREAFVAYCGMPEKSVPVESAQDVLAESNIALTETAFRQSADRLDGWQVADNVLELGIGIAAVLGGVYGTKAAGYLKNARSKSKALREVIEGNEIFKRRNQQLVAAFKAAQAGQSSQTRQIVAEHRTAIS